MIKELSVGLTSHVSLHNSLVEDPVSMDHIGRRDCKRDVGWWKMSSSSAADHWPVTICWHWQPAFCCHLIDHGPVITFSQHRESVPPIAKSRRLCQTLKLMFYVMLYITISDFDYSTDFWLRWYASRSRLEISCISFVIWSRMAFSRNRILVITLLY